MTVMVALIRLIGWHWEFLPSFVAELVPGLDLVPFWTLPAVNVYRKWRRLEGAVRVIDVEPIERKLKNP